MKLINKVLAALSITPLVGSYALADGTAAGQDGGSLQMIIILVVFFAIFYFLLIRPQMKRNKDHRQMLSEVAKGDEIVTNGGIIGKVAKVGESFIDITIADNVTIQVQKDAVTSILPKGTTKSS
ncbi:preprotein translocase subunit YajC [Thiotrichales bacterium 19S3-7]|nr:preprotein translocase subunit YajC [Thiotrichales bacterium 19S3-7]MCF6801554.1 preprotein translocase subunit YajC [Thiotrichales bacterium 19S3-11]